jgi:hypothetical protein
VGVVEKVAKRFYCGINPKTNLHRSANNTIMPIFLWIRLSHERAIFNLYNTYLREE